MELILGLHNLHDRHRGCALTMGKFDGVHLGHQALLQRTRQHASAMGLPATVLTFDPSPREFFAPQDAPPRVLTLRDKLAALAHQGVDRVVSVRFGARLAEFSPARFLEQILVGNLGARAMIVGDDARFGRQRSGDTGYLRSREQEFGYVTSEVGTVMAGCGERCSSSGVRDALERGDFARVQRLLGRAYQIAGRVRRGLQLGRKLDMPTANIAIHRRLALPMGVYAVSGRFGGRQMQGVASLGVRPTLGLTQCLLETHLFGEPGELYGQMLAVEFHSFLRPELRFDSLDALKQQMHADAAEARQRLAA